MEFENDESMLDGLLQNKQFKSPSKVNPILRIKNNIILSIVTYSLFFLGSCWFAYQYLEMMGWFCVALFNCYAIWVIVSGVNQLRSIETDLIDESTKALLLNQLKSIKKWVKYQEFMALPLYPVSLLLGLEFSEKGLLLKLLGHPEKIPFWIVIVVLIVMTIVSFYFSRYGFHLMFGKNIKRIESSINDLEEE